MREGHDTDGVVPLPCPPRAPGPPRLVPVLIRCGATAEAAESVEADLLSRWREPHRRYHDHRHLAEVLDRVEHLAAHAVHLDRVRCAAWWHDAVHDGRAGDDERASAALAREQLSGLGVPDRDVEAVARLVLLTVDHDPGSPPDPDAAVLCDADLGVLAAPARRYDGYAADVRLEYAHVPDAQFNHGRSAVLRGLLTAPRLFRTPTGAAWEEPARDNVNRELARLAAQR